MRNRILVRVVLLVPAAIAACVVGAHIRSRSGPITSPVEALNRSVQERFQTLTGFGMSRMPVVPQHVQKFDPETSEETAAVEELRRQGLTVGLYLGGRGLLESPMTKAEWDGPDKFNGRRAISKPILITGDEPLAGLPEPWELWEIGQRALEASAKSDKYQAPFGRWTVDARPIRAQKEGCLTCHQAQATPGTHRRGTESNTPLKVGDALGVVVYVYARSR
jgi:hypothetical protein